MNEFEQMIMKCCEMDEWDLRSWIRDTLTANGFTVQEDEYSSYRKGRYQEVHNMLSIRGEKPAVCLVAHTDVCRDHRSSKEHLKATPIVKEVNKYGKEMRIIQDEHCRVQVGGDDRLGVAISMWIALNSKYDMAFLASTDEEVGNQSADEVKFPELMDFELLCQIDRGNHSNQLVTNISGLRLCSPEIATRLLKIAEDMGVPRYPVQGMMTDVLAIKGNDRCRNAVNMTCGYHASFGSSSEEYIDVQEAYSTMQYVDSIIKNFADEKINGQEFEIADQITNEEINSYEETEQYAL